MPLTPFQAALSRLLAQIRTADSNLLAQHGYSVRVEISRPGYIRAIVSQGGVATKVETWAACYGFKRIPPR